LVLRADSRTKQNRITGCTPATDSLGATASWFGAMADVAMEIWGKASGGRVAAAHLVFVCCVVCCVCVWCSAPVNFLGVYPVNFLSGHAR
jgi:hypothetical protein